MFESKHFTHFFGISIYQTVLIYLSEFLICLNQKILFVFGIFANQTVLTDYIRISDMFKSKHFTRFCNIYIVRLF